MEAKSRRIRLIVNADDFGISRSANRAIITAHKEGILTSTSLMVNGGFYEDAIERAKATPSLKVGLHLVLVCGRSTLKPSEIIGVCDHHYQFDRNPFKAGFRYFFESRLHQYIRQEIDAQFRKFRTHGLQLDHLNGHLNFHMHPTVMGMIKRDYQKWGVRGMRLTRDPLLTNLRLAPFGRYFYRLSHAAIFGQLSGRVRDSIVRRGIKHPQLVFGLLQNDHVNEKYLLKLIDNLFPGTFEVYCHPDEDEHAHELEALCSPRVRERIQERGIELITYSDL